MVCLIARVPDIGRMCSREISGWFCKTRRAPTCRLHSFISDIGDLNQMNSGVYCVPMWLNDNNFEIAMSELQRRPNLSGAAQFVYEGCLKTPC